MFPNLPPYTAVIRTLGKAGEKYQALLNSLIRQSHKPDSIIVYLAEGFPIPKETVHKEKIVYVPKGMVAQRALRYEEVKTEWILFLDDDMAIENFGVERILRDTIKCNADVCAIDGFPHHTLSLKKKLGMILFLSCIPRLWGSDRGYRLHWLDICIYNPNPVKSFGWSTLNSGNAFICKKKDFLKLHFEDDLWLDDAPYAFPEDKVMFYKMHLSGLKIITHFNSGFTHLDAASSLSDERLSKMYYSEARNNEIFTHKYILPFLSKPQKIIFFVVKFYRSLLNHIHNKVNSARRNNKIDKIQKQGRIDACHYLKSQNR